MSRQNDKFELKLTAPASFSGRRLSVGGRFQTFVRPGSQYAIWNQFPSAVRYEIEAPDGSVEISMDLELSISEDGDSIFNTYADMPANQVVSESYDENVFDLVSDFVSGPGHYRIRALYFGVESPWIDVDILA